MTYTPRLKPFLIFAAVIFLLMLCLYKANAQDTIERFHENGAISQVIIKSKSLVKDNGFNRALYPSVRIQPPPVDYSQCFTKWIYKPTGAVIHIVIAMEGYTINDTAKARTDATNLVTAFFNSDSIYNAYKTRFDVQYAFAPSPQSGAKHPKSAGDCPAVTSQPIDNPTNNWNTTFDYGGTHRLLYSSDQTNLSSFFSTMVPNYTVGMVLVNSPYYGGSGGKFATGSTHSSSAEIMAHEFGHTFVKLADEYGGAYCTGAEKANVTKETNRDLIKWKQYILPSTQIPTPAYTNCSTIGLYLGANYCTNGGWYRPACDCKMRTLGKPLCKVCRNEFVVKVNSYGTPVQPPTVTITPAATTINLGQSATLTASGADSYVWSNGLTMNPITVSPTVNSTYSVTGTKNGLTGTATSTVNVTQPPTSNCTPFITAAFTPGYCTLRITTTKTFNQFRYCQHHWTGGSFVLAAACNDYKSSTGTFPYAYLYTEVVDNDPNILTVKIKQRISASRMKVTVQDLGCSNKLEFTSP